MPKTYAFQVAIHSMNLHQFDEAMTTTYNHEHRRSRPPAGWPAALATIFFLSVCAVPACAGPAGRPVEKTRDMNAPQMAPDNLPFAKGTVFKALDDYLAYRRKLGALDRPYYEETAPGVYRLVGARLPSPAETYTRQQLMEKFGFTR